MGTVRFRQLPGVQPDGPGCLLLLSGMSCVSRDVYIDSSTHCSDEISEVFRLSQIEALMASNRSCADISVNDQKCVFWDGPTRLNQVLPHAVR